MQVKHGVLVGVLAILAVFVAETAAAQNWTDPGVITQMSQQNAMYQDVFVTISWTGSNGCSSPTGFWLSVSDERRKRIFTMLLAAQAAGQQVRVWFTGTCHAWGHAQMDGVIVIS
jgi:hypothetical protein